MDEDRHMDEAPSMRSNETEEMNVVQGCWRDQVLQSRGRQADDVRRKKREEGNPGPVWMAVVNPDLLFFTVTFLSFLIARV